MVVAIHGVAVIIVCVPSLVRTHTTLILTTNDAFCIREEDLRAKACIEVAHHATFSMFQDLYP